MLHNYVDKAVVINLDRRPGRLEQFKSRLDKIDPALFLSIDKFSAIDGKSLGEKDPRKAAQNGCKESHLQILKDAKKNGHRNIMVFEDDATFSKTFTTDLDSFLAKVPSDWDMIYLGGNYWGKEHLTDNVFQVTALALHGYIIQQSLYDYIIDKVSLIDLPIDVLYRDYVHMNPKYKTYGCYPQIVGQAAGYSDIEQYDVDTRSILGHVE